MSMLVATSFTVLKSLRKLLIYRNCEALIVRPFKIRPIYRDQQVETFHRSVRSLDESVKLIYDRINESQKRLVGREFATLISVYPLLQPTNLTGKRQQPPSVPSALHLRLIRVRVGHIIFIVDIKHDL